MKFSQKLSFLNIILSCVCCIPLTGQTVVNGIIEDATTGEPLISASVIVKGTSEGTVTDFDGKFEFTTTQEPPFTLIATYVGYTEQELEVTSGSPELTIRLAEDAITTETVEITGQRISDKQKASPLTVESLDVLAIKETPADNFYDGLGSLKGVDLTAASLGFKVVNMRGFNSTSPVRTLQLIDGVDNQAPGLNFSLGNFLGSPELDVLKVDLIQGASSAFYGPNAFNGVISIETKNPFYHRGLSASVKAGERNLVDLAARYADAFQNKKGEDFLAFKVNFAFLRADDWEAENYNPIDESRVPASNPGRFDAVNIYGDSYAALGDFTSASNQFGENAGLGTFYRVGYREIDLVDYDTRNIKANAGLFLRTKPNLGTESPELIWQTNFGYGTTVYQGDNRFSLRNITFFQHRLEYRLRNKFFIRAYVTQEDAGDSYDPFFTALKLQERAKSDEDWYQDYNRYWKNQNFSRRMQELGYPRLDFSTFPPTFDFEAAEQWIADNNELLSEWHAEAAEFANNDEIEGNQAFFQPGTERFEREFNDITTRLSNDEEDGTQFFDKSELYHIQGEYKFEPSFVDEWTVGASGRYYTPESRGTVFDDFSRTITNYEFGFYTGLDKKVLDDKLRLSATVRVDKNENFDWVSTPAASAVYNPRPNTFIRASFSSAVRNPTLTDQFLNLNVGPAILAGNLNGVDSLITTESFDIYRNTLALDSLEYFSIDGVQPEKVRTFEAGFRTTLFNSVYVDAGYYYNIYRDFLGFNIGIDAEFGGATGLPTDVQVFRYSANSREEVQTQGFSIGLNYYFGNYYQISGNYSWNKLISDVDDPIIPAFNTPEHKFNIGVSGRSIQTSWLRDWGFNVNYKWIDGFLFEGSPQFTGFVPQYSLLDAQINKTFRRINTTLKIGATNLLDNEQFQTFGGPRIGRLAYVSLLYDFKKQ